MLRSCCSPVGSTANASRCSGRGSSPSTRASKARRPRRSAAPRRSAPTTGLADLPRAGRGAGPGCGPVQYLLPPRHVARRPVRSEGGTVRADLHPGRDPDRPRCGARDGAGARRGDACALTYFGDGSASEGDFHEAANLAGVFRAPVILFCQNNGWAISCRSSGRRRARSGSAPRVRLPGRAGRRQRRAGRVPATREAVDRAHRGGGPTLIEALTYRIGAHSTADDGALPRRRRGRARAAFDPIARFRAWLVLGGTRRRRGVLAECDRGADVRAIRDGVIAQRRLRPPNGCSTGRTPTRRRSSSGSASIEALDETTTMVAALNAALHDALGGRRPGAGVRRGRRALGGVFRVTDGLSAAFGDRRVFDTPIAEAGIVGAAVGLAFAGGAASSSCSSTRSPTRRSSRSSTTSRRCGTARAGASTCPITIRIPSFGGIKGKEHHGESPETYYVHTAGLKVVVPSTPGDAYACCSAWRSPTPTPWSSSSRRPVLDEGGDRPHDRRTADRRGAHRARGRRRHALAYGAMVARVLEAATTGSPTRACRLAWSTSAPCPRSTST